VPKLDVIVIGASAGGLEALLDILRGVPANLPAAMFVVIHTRADASSRLAHILSRETELAVSFAKQREPVVSGRVYVAPPDFHLLITPAGVALNHGPRENGFRPAVDPLFRSAARVYGARVMGIVLSGALDDGTYGLKLIKDEGGVTVVQDPEEAPVPGMPLSAIRHVDIDHVLPAADIAKLISDAVGDEVKRGDAVATKKESEPLAADTKPISEMRAKFGPPSAMTCPDCGGALWEIEEGKLTRYRCHVGHQYSGAGLDAGQSDVVEAALWTAVRALEEHADLRSRMSRRADTAGLSIVATSFAETAVQAHTQAQIIRDLLTTTDGDRRSEGRLGPTPEHQAPRFSRPRSTGNASKRRINGRPAKRKTSKPSR